MHNGRTQLRAWIERRSLNQRQAAKEIGFHWTQLNKILLGIRNPGLLLALRIERSTGIPVEAWVPTSEPAMATAGAGNGRTRRVGK